MIHLMKQCEQATKIKVPDSADMKLFMRTQEDEFTLRAVIRHYNFRVII